MVTIIDYGIGNLRSIEKAFEAVGAAVLRTDDPEALAQAERVVLPGVGAFGACADEIRRRGLEQPIRDAVAAGKPFLGVCVGMQLLFEVSEEMGAHRGLGLLPGRVVRFQGAYEPASAACTADDGSAGPVEADVPVLKVPHMGWNTVAIQREAPLLRGLDDGAYFYFVHSYHAAPERPEDVLGLTTYGVPFPAIVGRNNVYGVQFHPEKSQRNGLRILENFAAMTT
ncbi:imidazole glycerol phosphate synthase subunit HisH [Rhodothermaceae bacterium RA]|nr:imidazole glycerol phosphate synthase subunit HisH [Rhodothermaceae bacterium RA]